jgi:uncharacterized protein
MNIFPRNIASTLSERLKTFPVVAITGPRQAGKTTLAKTYISKLSSPWVYLDLELPSHLNMLRNSELFLKQNEDKLVVIDEVQRKPELFSLIRALVDMNRVPARFLILGSASPELLKQSSETLAGRISYLELTPFHWLELPNISYQKHWLTGGFPPALFAENEEHSFQWLEDFLATFIERDLPQFGLSAASQSLRNLLRMLLGNHGSLLNQNKLANSLGITMPTVKRYLSYLESAYFIRFLSPWHANISKRLVKTPKVFFRDTGVLHVIASIFNMNQLIGNQIAGASWEGYVIQQILANLPQGTQPYFYRTKEGSELDLILVRGEKPVIAFEMKMSSQPGLSKGNRIAMNDLGNPLTLIVAPSVGNYPLDENVQVCDIEHLWEYLNASSFHFLLTRSCNLSPYKSL